MLTVIVATWFTGSADVSRGGMGEIEGDGSNLFFAHPLLAAGDSLTSGRAVCGDSPAHGIDASDAMKLRVAVKTLFGHDDSRPAE